MDLQNKNDLPKIVQDFHSKCGEVYLSNNGNLLFHCHLCNENFVNFKFFFHLCDEHILQYNNEQMTIEKVTPSNNASLNDSINIEHTYRNLPNSPINKSERNSISSENMQTQIPSLDINLTETDNTSKKEIIENNIQSTTVPNIPEEQKIVQNRSYDESFEYNIRAKSCETLKIIDFIRDKPIFYQRHPIASIEEKLIAAQPLAEKLKKTSQRILLQINYIKKKYQKEKKRIAQDPIEDQTQWKWYTACRFLDVPNKRQILVNTEKSNIPMQNGPTHKNNDYNLNIENDLAYPVQEYKNETTTSNDNVEKPENEINNINKPSVNHKNKINIDKISINIETEDYISEKENINKTACNQTIANLDINLPRNNKNKTLNTDKFEKEIDNVKVNTEQIEELINETSTSSSLAKATKRKHNGNINKLEQYENIFDYPKYKTYKSIIQLLLNYLYEYPHFCSYTKEIFSRNQQIQAFAKENNISEDQLYNTLQYLKGKCAKHKITNNLEKWLTFNTRKQIDEQLNIGIVPPETIDVENIETISIPENEKTSINEYDPLDITIDDGKLKEIEKQKRKNLICEFSKDWTEEPESTDEDANLERCNEKLSNISNKNIDNMINAPNLEISENFHKIRKLDNLQNKDNIELQLILEDLTDTDFENISISTKNYDNAREPHIDFFKNIQKIREIEILKHESVKKISQHEFIKKLIDFIKDKSILNALVNANSDKIIALLTPLSNEINTSVKGITETINLIKEKYRQEKNKVLDNNSNKWAWFEDCKVLDTLTLLNTSSTNKSSNQVLLTSSKQKHKANSKNVLEKKCEHTFNKQGSKFLKCEYCEKFFILDSTHQGKFKRYKEILPICKKLFGCHMCSETFVCKKMLQEHLTYCKGTIEKKSGEK